MKKTRKSNKRINHHCGKLALHHRAEKYMVQGHKVPFVAAFEEAYNDDLNGRKIVEKVKERLQEVVDEMNVHGLDEPISKDNQLDLICDELAKYQGKKSRKGWATKQSGQHYLQMKEELEKTIAEAAAKEEASKAAMFAMEERIRALEEMFKGADVRASSDGSTSFMNLLS